MGRRVHIVRVNGYFSKRTLYVLIDFGNTHNLLNVELVATWSVLTHSLIDGNQLNCKYISRAFHCVLLGSTVTLDMFFILLGGGL